MGLLRLAQNQTSPRDKTRKPRSWRPFHLRPPRYTIGSSSTLGDLSISLSRFDMTSRVKTEMLTEFVKGAVFVIIAYNIEPLPVSSGNLLFIVVPLQCVYNYCWIFADYLIIVVDVGQLQESNGWPRFIAVIDWAKGLNLCRKRNVSKGP